MELLLDTHVVLWLEGDSKRIPAAVKSLITKEPNIAVSIASFWEIAIKIKLGKLNVKKDLNRFAFDFVNDYKCRLLSISLDDIFATEHLPLHHRDPFDRLLIAQATVNRMQLVSADTVFDNYAVNRIW